MTKKEKELFQAIACLDTAEEVERFFVDLCTPQEIADMADRWRVARLLDEGIAYRDINQRTGVSTATVTRVARSLRFGREGYRRALDRMNEGRDENHERK